MVVINVVGLDKVEKMTKFLSDAKNYDKLLSDVVFETWIKAREYAPEDTGKMENSIQIRKVGDSWQLFIDGRVVPYAVYNEFGTYKVPAGDEKNPIPYVSTSGKSCYRPFLRPAAYYVLQNLNNIVEKFIIEAKR